MTTNRLTYPYRRRGLDHDWFLHEPTHTRPSVVVATGANASHCGSRSLSNFSRSTRRRNRSVRLGGLMLGYPDLWNYSSRDYGARIGIYRIMRVLDELGLRATAAVNSAAVTQYPRLVDELVQRKWEILANGVDMGHVHHSGVAVEDERELIRNAQETLQRASGAPVKGWHSPGRSHSPNTLTLLAERGFEYVTDWANDDMPYTMTTKAGPLCAMPLTYEWSTGCYWSNTISQSKTTWIRCCRRLHGWTAESRPAAQRPHPVALRDAVDSRLSPPDRGAETSVRPHLG